MPATDWAARQSQAPRSDRRNTLISVNRCPKKFAWDKSSRRARSPGARYPPSMRDG